MNQEESKKEESKNEEEKKEVDFRVLKRMEIPPPACGYGACKNE